MIKKYLKYIFYTIQKLKEKDISFIEIDFNILFKYSYVNIDMNGDKIHEYIIHNLDFYRKKITYYI